MESKTLFFMAHVTGNLISADWMLEKYFTQNEFSRIPAWELTYPLPKVLLRSFESMMFLFSRVGYVFFLGGQIQKRSIVVVEWC